MNETDSVRFLFDTGADGSVINSDSGKQLHMKIDGEQCSNGSNTVAQSTGNSVVFSGLEQKDILFTLIPFGTNSFDGVFGTNLMKNYIMEIDYDRRSLKFSDAARFKSDLSAYEKIKIQYRFGFKKRFHLLEAQLKSVFSVFPVKKRVCRAITDSFIWLVIDA